MSEYATLKRRPILFPDSVSSFHDSIFSLKEGTEGPGCR